jgi:hypothetical protein
MLMMDCKDKEVVDGLFEVNASCRIQEVHNVYIRMTIT